MKRKMQSIQVEVDSQKLKRVIYGTSKKPQLDLEDIKQYDDSDLLEDDEVEMEQDMGAEVDIYDEDNLDIEDHNKECDGTNCPFARCKNCEYLSGLIKNEKDYKKIHKSRFTVAISYVIIVLLIALVFYVLGITFFPEQTNNTISGAITWVTSDDGFKGLVVKAFNTCKEVFNRLSNVSEASSSRDMAYLFNEISVY